MAKRFKLRICRVISTTLHSCRSKDPSILPQDPVPSFSSAAAAAVDHRFSIDTPQPPLFKWQREEKWHVVAKIHHPRHNFSASCPNSDPGDLSTPPPLSSSERNRKRAKKKKRNVPSRLRLSTSSADSGWFSSEGCATSAAAADDEETETLVSSSPNSSSESKQLHPIRETHRRCKKRAPSKRSVSGAAAEGETPARLSVFKKLIPCTVEGKVKESFAIVKKSEDPYEDFKSSMMDMVLEKQMFEREDLEQLLQCFLSLNSRQYHGVIVEAFSEIWNAIFSPTGSKPVHHHRRSRLTAC